MEQELQIMLNAMLSNIDNMTPEEIEADKKLIKKLNNGPSYEEFVSSKFLTPKMLIINGFEEDQEYEHEEYGLGSMYTLETNEGTITIFWRDSCNTMTCAGTEDLIKEVWELTINGPKGWFEAVPSESIFIEDFMLSVKMCGLNSFYKNFKIK